jgi:hypothetical protein
MTNKLYIAEAVLSSQYYKEKGVTLPNAFKIGITSNELNARERGLIGTKSYTTVIMRKAWELDNASVAEADLHNVFSGVNVGGEYFDDHDGNFLDKAADLLTRLYPNAIPIDLGDATPDEVLADRISEESRAEKMTRICAPFVEQAQADGLRVSVTGHGVRLLDLDIVTAIYPTITDGLWTIAMYINTKMTPEQLEAKFDHISLNSVVQRNIRSLRTSISGLEIDEAIRMAKYFDTEMKN